MLSKNTKKISKLIAISSVLGLIEIAIVGIIIPIIINRSASGNKWLSTYLNYSENALFYIYISSLMLLILLKLFFNRYSTKYIKSYSVQIGRDILNDFYSKKYEDLKSINSSYFINLMTVKLDEYTEVYYSILMLASNAITLIILTIFFSFYNFKILLISFLILLVTYLIFSPFKEKMLKNSESASFKHPQLHQHITEYINSYKDVINSSAEQLVVNKYVVEAAELREIQLENKKITSGAKVIFDSVILIFIACIFLVDQSRENLFDSLVYVVMIQRMVPIIGAILSSMSTISSAYDSFCEVRSVKLSLDLSSHEKNNFSFKSLVINNLHYKYKNKINVLNGINLRIEFGDKVAIIGRSGSGKTTLIEIIAGFLDSYSGEIYVNDLEFKPNDWKRFVGYVPQKPFLIDASLKDNITFGSLDDIDNDRYNDLVLRMQLDKLPEHILNNKVSIGEGGSLLSGGQSQRVAIARALYRNSEFIILDEATSSLDSTTEREILENLLKDNNITVIMVTHKLETLNYFSKIIKIDNGQAEIIK